MRALILFSFLLGATSALKCTLPYQYIDGIGCIKELIYNKRDTLDNLLPSSRDECAKDGAHLPVIKTKTQNDMYNRIVLEDTGDDDYGVYLVLDLICDEKSKRLVWIDGTFMDYLPPNSRGLDFDCTATNFTATSDPYDNRWLPVALGDKWYYSVACVIDEYYVPTAKPTGPTVGPTAQPETQCGDYSVMPVTADGSKPCYKIFPDSTSWNNAQNQCSSDFGSFVTINSAEENKFFWRTAISFGLIEGVHIGAHQSKDDSSSWTWIDGEVPISGKAYDNFIGSFPIPGGGSCTSMMTETTNALWINENCQENNQPFICRRADFSVVPSSCQSSPPKVGEDFFPPDFPNADTPCEYVLFVGANKLVQLEVITLVAEENKDFLEVLEGSSGPHLLANLTGSILIPTNFKTEKSNILRVNWKPSGSGSGRGFRIRYNEVDI